MIKDESRVGRRLKKMKEKEGKLSKKERGGLSPQCVERKKRNSAKRLMNPQEGGTRRKLLGKKSFKITQEV